MAKKTKLGLVDTALSYLTRRGFKSGALEGNRVWAILGIAAVVVRYLRKTGGPKVVYRQEIEVGQSLLISHGKDSGSVVVTRDFESTNSA